MFDTDFCKAPSVIAVNLLPHILSDDSYDTLNTAGEYGRTFRVHHGYAALGPDRGRQPHVIALLEHHFDGDKKISRAEVLTILVTTITQLEHAYLDGHCITPVMIFSFVNSFQRRVLQTRVTDNGISVQKSELYNFRTQNDFEDSVGLFSRYMASTRMGDTRKLVAFDIKAQEMPVLTNKVATANLKDVAPTLDSTLPAAVQDIGKGKE
ncbi:hypothetical protein NFIA_002260 [Paecilomyces variotii No. 5]|uniref:Uncharacterized protein n=1 Tax=Byssochlamys spectabilis (strain No. 5 / NBRC 109023) TaxID=1356009 RepID=V5G6M6_BYSSN|nr:hypothetical protein NFIA_002260 [Paecilomyces variotii No. 5]